MNFIKQRLSRAIKDLGLKVNFYNSQHDQSELTQLLIYTLDFPDILLGEKHQKSVKLGNYDLIQEQSKLQQVLKIKSIEDINVCQCCGMIVNQSQISFCTKIQDIKIGVGTFLYFNNIKYNIIILTMMFFIFSLFSLIINKRSCSYSSFNDCGLDGISLSSTILKSSQHQGVLTIGSILSIVTVILWGFIQLYKFHIQKTLETQADQNQIDVSQFTLMLQNFPASYFRQPYREAFYEIQKIFKKYEKRMNSELPYELVKINVAHNIYRQKQQKKQVRESLQTQLNFYQTIFKQWVDSRRHSIQFPVPLDQRKQFYEEYDDFYFQKYDKQFEYKTGTHQKNIVFVTLRYSNAVNQIQKQLQPFSIQNICSYFSQNKVFPIQNVRVTRALPPEQINWENVGFSSKQKFIRSLIVYIISFIFLAVSLIMATSLNYLKIAQNSSYISAIMSVGITIINMVLQLVILNLSYIMNLKTKTQEQFSIAFRICLFQLLNVIGVPLLALYLSKKQLYGNKGLTSDIFYIALLNILTPIGRFIDPWSILIHFRNKFYMNANYRLWKFKGQTQFNKIYEDNQFDLGYEYSYVIKTTIFTAFFITLQPIIVIFAIIGLILLYFINKYRVFYRFGKPKYYSTKVNSLVNILFNFSPIFFGLGLLVFTNWQQAYRIQNTLILNWIVFSIAALFFILPFRVIYNFIDEPKTSNLDYYDKKPIFPTQYDRMNPVTKDSAISIHKTYLQELKTKQKLPMMSMIINSSLFSTLRESLPLIGQKLKSKQDSNRQTSSKILLGSIYGRKFRQDYSTNKIQPNLKQFQIILHI